MIALISLAAVILVALLIVRWLVRYWEPQLAFYPVTGEDITPAAHGVPFAALDAKTRDDVRLRVWHVPREDARAQVLYFHGNGGNLSMWADVLVELARRDFDVIAFDYRGYGVSSGSPTEQGLYRDADAVLDLVHGRLRLAGAPLVYWGRSLGATVAAYAASVRTPDGVILEAGFPSMRAVIRTNPVMSVLSWFATYEFPTARWMSRARAPVLLLHGDADSVIPYALGRELYDAIPGKKTFFTIKDGDHNDAAPRDAEAYWRAIDDFIDGLRPL